MKIVNKKKLITFTLLVRFLAKIYFKGRLHRVSYVASHYIDGNCLSCQQIVFHMKMEDVFLETLLIFPDLPADQIPLNVDRIERFSTQSGRFS